MSTHVKTILQGKIPSCVCSSGKFVYYLPRPPIHIINNYARTQNMWLFCTYLFATYTYTYTAERRHRMVPYRYFQRRSDQIQGESINPAMKLWRKVLQRSLQILEVLKPGTTGSRLSVVTWLLSDFFTKNCVEIKTSSYKWNIRLKLERRQKLMPEEDTYDKDDEYIHAYVNLVVW